VSHPDPGTVPDYEAWFRRSGGEILRQAYFCIRDQALAEDIAQEVAIKAYKAWTKEETRDKILTQPGYVRTMIKNAFLDHIKVPSRTNLGEVELDIERHSRPDTEMNQDLRLAVLSLEDDEFHMIIFRYYHDLTITEAGARLGLSASQAFRLHSKARAHLARLLNEKEV
jgi:RNA polymerase sigma factor (sigma-70 family)